MTYDEWEKHYRETYSPCTDDTCMSTETEPCEEIDVDMHKERELDCKMVDGIPNSGFYAMVLINGLALGVERWQRIGRTVRMESLRFVPAYGDSAPVFIVYDKAPTGSLPAYSDIFSGYNNDGGTPFGRSLMLNPDYLDRFEIVWSAQSDLTCAQATQMLNQSSVPPEIYIDLEGRVTQYSLDFNNVVPDITGITSGALYAIDVYQFRLYYNDT